MLILERYIKNKSAKERSQQRHDPRTLSSSWSLLCPSLFRPFPESLESQSLGPQEIPSVEFFTRKAQAGVVLFLFLNKKKELFGMAYR